MGKISIKEINAQLTALFDPVEDQWESLEKIYFEAIRSGERPRTAEYSELEAEPIRQAETEAFKQAVILVSKIPSADMPRLAVYYFFRFNQLRRHEQTIKERLKEESVKRKDEVETHRRLMMRHVTTRKQLNEAEKILAKATKARRKGAATMLANSEKQKEKALVRECWEAWQKKPETYKSKSAFAINMVRKWDNLGSQRVIEGWCRIWERESKTSLS